MSHFSNGTFQGTSWLSIIAPIIEIVYEDTAVLTKNNKSIIQLQSEGKAITGNISII